jgi:hypothetical protein
MNVHNESEVATEIGLTRLKTLLSKAGYSHATPDVAKMKGLKVGVHVVQGDDWQDKSGETRKGGGQTRDRNAYFAPSDEAVAAVAAAPTGATSTSKKDSFDDDIPF